MVPGRVKIAIITGSSLAIATLGLAGCGTNSQVAATTSVIESTTNPSLPPMKRFRIGGENYGPVQDCTVSGEAVTCTSSWDDPYQVDTYTGSYTGTMKGLEMTGTSTTTQTGHDADNPDCLWTMETSTPLTYTFTAEGTVTARYGSDQWRKSKGGNCSGTESGTDTGGGQSGPIRWTVIE